jgi:hypothetical protein
MKELLGEAALTSRSYALAYSNPDAVHLALVQAVDGTWNHTILATPAENARSPQLSVGTSVAVHRLLELGWEKEAPPFQTARRPLFRLLAEDTDPSVLYELRSGGNDIDGTRWSRGVLRGAAAAALAHAGYETDPRLRGAAQRMIDRVDEFISSPLAEDPWVKQGSTSALSPEAFPPTIHFLLMLAYMPGFVHEHDDFADRLVAYLTRPLPRHAAAQWIGAEARPHTYALLGDPLGTRAAADNDLSFALLVLELAARGGYLRRHAGWQRVLSRLLDERDRDLVWRPSRHHAAGAVSPASWPFVHLQGRGARDMAPEITFRLALIARHAGYTVDFI